MTTIFVSYASEDTACVEHIRTGLEACSYRTWRKPSSLTLEFILYPHTIEQMILSSAAILLVWSSAAVQSDWVERHILFAQQLKKPIIPVVIDGTSLPTTLIVSTIVTSLSPCTAAVAQLLPHLPPPESTDPLIALSEKAAHEFIRIRKEAIDQATDMLKRDEHREAVLALLEYLAHNDLMMGVREKAQEALDASNGIVASPALRPGESRHIFGVRCKNGHISYFDKRHVCRATRPELRGLLQRAGKELDELHLSCDTCQIEVVARVDCEGYK